MQQQVLSWRIVEHRFDPWEQFSNRHLWKQQQVSLSQRLFCRLTGCRGDSALWPERKTHPNVSSPSVENVAAGDHTSNFQNKALGFKVKLYSRNKCVQSEIDSSVSVDMFIRAGHVCFFLMDTARLKVSTMAALIDRCPKIGHFSHSLSHRSGPLVVFHVIFILYPV